jgi:hypothetical protein
MICHAGLWQIMGTVPIFRMVMGTKKRYQVAPVPKVPTVPIRNIKEIFSRFYEES